MTSEKLWAFKEVQLCAGKWIWFDLTVCRLVEEVKQKCAGVQLQNEDVYMATTFQDFIQIFVRKLRGEDQEEELTIDYVSPISRFNTQQARKWYS